MSRRLAHLAAAAVAVTALATGSGCSGADREAQPSASSPLQSSSPSIGAAKPVALVYRGPAACPGCAEAAAAMVEGAGGGYEIRYAGPRETLKLEPGSFRGVSLYVQSGGDISVDRAPELIGADGLAAVEGFVRSGGHYLGICQGAYLAGVPGMGLLTPGDTGRYIDSHGAVTDSEGDKVIPVVWNGQPRMMFFQDGPYIDPPHRSGERTVATYTNGLAAAVITPVDRGWIGLIGPHPEAPPGWYEGELAAQDTDATDIELGRDFVEQLMSAER